MTDPTLAMQARVLLAPMPRAAMLQFMSLLPLPAADIEALVAREVESNPALEQAAGWTCATCGRFSRAVRCDACSFTIRPLDVAAKADWREMLRSQARLEVSAAMYPLLDEVIDSLDDHGFLAEAPEDADSVVAALRSVGPPGIAAASALDCVRLQVDALIAEARATPLVRTIVDDWLPQLADERWNDIAQGMDVSEAEVREAVEILTRETRPFVSLDGGAEPTGMVDVEFVLRGTDLTSRVQNADGLGLRVADDFGYLDQEARAWLAPHRAAASQLVAAVNARAHVLSQVAEILATRQRTYLIVGGNHQPLRRAEVAAEIGVHPSTVGRAVAGKVARCPDGRLLPLATLFGAGSSTLERVAAVIADSPNATDSALADELTRRGWPIARRTVAKYRALLAGSTTQNT